MRNIKARTGDLRSSVEEFCEGALDPSRYVVAIMAAAAKVPQRFGHEGSRLLDEICAFDAAERSGAYLGQTNLIEVSSFCGPGGLIWGHDLARATDPGSDLPLLAVGPVGGQVGVYDATPLIAASTALLGTVSRPAFRILPGSLCPAAYKSRACAGPATCFAAIALGIVEDRDRSACIFMEDAGSFAPSGPLLLERERVLRSVSESVLLVAENQGLRCARIYAAYASVAVDQGEVGCALVAAPYLRLAGRVWPRGGLRRLRQMTLDDWISECRR